jgi:hypothetical protein
MVCEADRLRIIVLGYIVRGPLGGLAWHHLQYVMGLAQLGHDVYFLEDSDDYPSCYDPGRHVTDKNPAYGLRFATRAFARIGLGRRWAYFDAHTSRWFGPCADSIRDVCSSADLLLNVSGVNPLRPWLTEVPVRAFVDTDPVFTQVRHLTKPDARYLASQHTSFFTFGENVGHWGSTIPNDGFPWQPTRQPVVLDVWPVTPGCPQGKFTTVLQWESYPAAELDGVRYGMKAEGFRPYINLPEKTGAILELAVGGPSAPRVLLANRGWVVRNPLELTRDPWTYQRYIQQSKAEFSVAKHGYVVTRSGWFSERSAVYLASGRPVVVQETGFSAWMHTGLGAIGFSTPDEALAGIEEITRRYDLHYRAAREIAEEYFDARKVLHHLVEGAMNPALVHSCHVTAASSHLP